MLSISLFLATVGKVARYCVLNLTIEIEHGNFRRCDGIFDDQVVLLQFGRLDWHIGGQGLVKLVLFLWRTFLVISHSVFREKIDQIAGSLVLNVFHIDGHDSASI